MGGTGTGFFIDNNGTLITNYHVIENNYRMWVVLEDGGEYDVEAVLGYSKEKDLAVLRVKKSNTSYLNISGNDVTAGQAMYVHGSPKGIANVLTGGTVTKPLDDNNNSTKEFLHNASTSGGSSGSPVINEYGEVVGVEVAYYTDGNDLNVAIYASEIALVNMDIELSPSEFFYMDYEGLKGDLYSAGECLTSEEEPNNSLDNADTIWINGQTVEAEFSGIDDTDVYKALAGKDGKLYVFICPEASEDYDYLAWGIMDSNENLLDAKYDTDNSSGYRYCALDCVKGKTYYIAVVYDFAKYSYCDYAVYAFIK